MALVYNLPGALHTDSFTVGDYTYTGSSIYIDDGNGKWRIKFLSNGTFTPTKNVKVDIFAVGGGGGSGAGDGSSVSGTRGSNGSVNRGGGGGGGWNSAGGNGGSGVIIIRKAKNFTLTTTSTSYSFSSSTISSWTSARTIKVGAYTSYATCPGYSNEVTFTYKPASTNVTVAASKYATTDNSSFANSGGSSCVVGRSTSFAPVGTAMKFNAPSGGWGSYSRAVLHVYRTGGSASATVIVGHLNQAYSATIYCDQFYYNNYTSQIGTVSVGAASTWSSLDITSYKPSGSGEWGITLTSKNAYATVDGTNAYITLS